MPSLVDAANMRARLARETASLHLEGSLLYDAARHTQAALTWERSARAAEADSRTGDAAESRFWQGVALHGAGRLHQALVALGTVATYTDARAVRDRTRHMALTRAVLVAVDMPAPLASIERAIADVDRIEQHTGQGRTARLLLVRARLAQYRGQTVEALQLAREGLARADIEDAGFARGAYIKEALRACLRLRALADTEPLLERLDRVDDAYATTRSMIAATFRSMVARARGEVEVAVALGRIAWQRARQCDELSDIMLAASALVRALLCSGDAREARAPLASLLRHRHSQTGFARYEPRLLLGDYHAAMARFHCGLPALDAESSLTFGDAAGSRVAAMAERHREKARRAWHAAMRVGRAIDRRLECTTREAELALRLERSDEADSAVRPLPYITA